MDELKTYLQGMPVAEREAFAKRCGTSIGYLNNAIYNRVDPKVIKPETCALIEEESHRRVRRWHLRADWHRIWPELRRVKGAPEFAEAARS